jgi:hypothetical protein
MGFAPFYFWSGVGLGGAHLGEAFVELAGDVGDDTELALDEHELGAVVHFVFLGAEEAFEAGLDGFAIGVGDFFGENFGRDGFHPGGEAIAFGAQVIQNFRLGAELGFIGGDAVAEGEEVVANQGGNARGFVEFLKNSSGDGDVREHLADCAGVGSGGKAVAGFGDVFGYLDGVFANGAESVCEFFGAVGHGITSGGLAGL